MSDRPHGKYVTIDTENPAGVAICDYSGFVFNHKDLVRQMEWRGEALVWTGFMVGKPFVDQPNPQLRPDILAPDPVPFLDPRVQQQQTIIWNAGLGFTWNNLSMVTWESWGTNEDGTQAANPEQRLIALQNYSWSA